LDSKLDPKSLIDINLIAFIHDELSPEKDIDLLYESLGRLSLSLCNSDFSMIFLLNNNKLIMERFTSREEKEYLQNLNLFDFQYIAEEVLQTKDSMIINNLISSGRSFNILGTPLYSNNKFSGVLLTARAYELYSEEDKNILELIVMEAAGAITNRILYNSLKKRIEELNALYELSSAAVFSSSETDFFKRVLAIVASSLNVERASLVFYNTVKKHLELLASYGKDLPENLIIDDDSVAAYVFKTGKILNVRNINEELPDHIKSKGRGYGSDSFVSIPLYFEGQIVGVLNLTDKKNHRTFDSFEINVLLSIINHVTEIYKNYSIRRREEKRKKIEEELKIASEIQRRNLTKIPRHIGDIAISILYEPARVVGGDFFDYYRIRYDIAGFLIADVAGKGIPAALYTGSVKHILRMEQKSCCNPVDLFTQANKLIIAESEMGMFTTAFCAIIYQYDKRILFSSAGHNDQMLIKKSGDILRLKTSGKPLGIFEDVFFEQREIYYNNGDLLVLFTDGIAEALGGDDLDVDRGFFKLADIIIKFFDDTEEIILNRIRNEIREVSRDLSLADDLTLLLIRL